MESLDRHRKLLEIAKAKPDAQPYHPGVFERHGFLKNRENKQYIKMLEGPQLKTLLDLIKESDPNIRVSGNRDVLQDRLLDWWSRRDEEDEDEEDMDIDS